MDIMILFAMCVLSLFHSVVALETSLIAHMLAPTHALVQHDNQPVPRSLLINSLYFGYFFIPYCLLHENIWHSKKRYHIFYFFCCASLCIMIMDTLACSKVQEVPHVTYSSNSNYEPH